jgi:hypothetical protein
MSSKRVVGNAIAKGISKFCDWYESDGYGGKWSDCDKHNPWDI